MLSQNKSYVVHHFVYQSHNMWKQRSLAPRGPKLRQILSIVIWATLDPPIRVSGGGVSLFLFAFSYSSVKATSRCHFNFK